MAKTPGRRDHQPGRPARAPDNHHAGRRSPGRLLSVEGAHARNERTCIPAPVRMVRPDELPAATLGFLHPALTSTTTTSHSPPAKAVDTAQYRSCPAVTIPEQCRNAGAGLRRDHRRNAWPAPSLGGREYVTPTHIETAAVPRWRTAWSCARTGRQDAARHTLRTRSSPVRRLASRGLSHGVRAGRGVS